MARDQEEGPPPLQEGAVRVGGATPEPLRSDAAPPAPVRPVQEPQHGRRAAPPRVARRGDGFTDHEVDGLLTLLEEKLPLGRDEWDVVAHMHTEQFPGHDRVADSLKRKFSKLYRARVPTGNPHIPAPVKRAKRIREEMVERADMGDGDATQSVASIFGAAVDDTVQEQPAGDGPPEQEVHSPPPRPLVQGRSDVRRRGARTDEDAAATADLVTSLRLAIQLEQEQRQSAREEEARRREQERAERQEAQTVSQRNQDELMQLLVSVLGQQKANDNSHLA